MHFDLGFSFVNCFIGWNTKISARETNYGTRIDFILITPGLVPWIEAADIQPHVKGSDHCPLFVHLRDKITNSDGSVTKLRDVLGVTSGDGVNPPELPRLATKYWDEHKQRLLSTFFAKKLDCPSRTSAPPYSSSQQVSEAQTINRNESGQESSRQTSQTVGEEPQATGSTKRKIIVRKSPDPSEKKAKMSSQNQSPLKTKRKTSSTSGQSTIASFFSQSHPPATSTSTSGSRLSNHGSSSSLSPSCERQKSPQLNVKSHSPCTQHIDEDADHKSPFFLSGSEPPFSSPSSFQDTDNAKQAWRSFLAPTQIPKCTSHGEPAKEYTVNKPGPNKGKKFFICSRYPSTLSSLLTFLLICCIRPVGPGYDKGRTDRLREQVNPQFRCNFFKWSSEVRKQMRNESKELK